MKTKIFIAPVIFVFFIFSCKKETNQLIDIFPNNVGFEWTYRLYDNNNVNTIKVQIVGEGVLPNGNNAKIWRYTYIYPSKTYIDSVWVTDSNNDVRFYFNPCWSCTNQMPPERLHYILPFIVGQYWYTDADYGDTTKVLKQISVTVPAGSYNDVFCISRVQGYVENSWKFDTLYFKEHVGLVKFNQHENSLGPSIGDGTWELIKYNFK